MQAIRRFEDERKAWEHERSGFEERERLLSQEKSQFEQELAQLNKEVERLRTGQAASAPAQQGPVEPSASVRSHHEAQLALMGMIDGLRRELRQAQDRAQTFEQKVSEAERTNRRLAVELDRTREGGLAPSFDLDCSVRSVATRQFGAKGFLLDGALSPRKQPEAKASSGSAGSDEGRDELSETIRTLHTSRKEVLSLEDETLRLREDLNHEKQKVIELKRAAHSRAAKWKEELQKLTEELAEKQRLEEEVRQLRIEQVRWRKELSLAGERERAARAEVAKLQRDLEGNTSKKGAREEMEHLSSVMGGQLVAVEQELTQQMKKSSQLFEHFLRRAHDPLATVRRSCRRIAASGAAGKGLWIRPVPPNFEVDVHDLGTNLGKIVDILRFGAEVLEAREQQQEPPKPPLHKRDPAIREAGRGPPQEPPQQEGGDYGVSWLKPFIA